MAKENDSTAAHDRSNVDELRNAAAELYRQADLASEAGDKQRYLELRISIEELEFQIDAILSEAVMR